MTADKIVAVAKWPRATRRMEAPMTKVRLLLVCGLLALLPPAATSQVLTSHPEWIEDLRLGGYVIVFHHCLTAPDQVKTDSMSRSDVPALRELSDDGRAQAKSIGAAMRKLDIPVERVLTSVSRRALQSATLLGFDEVNAMAELTESGPTLSADENNRRAQALRKLVATWPELDNNVLIVSHRPNIIDAFGKDWLDVREGEASVFAPDGKGGYKLIVRIQADEWGKLARASK
jgi:phosphohistidine phosphatase SixA